jgi:protein SCO1/2
VNRRLKILAIFFILVFPSAVYVFLTAGKEKAFVRMPYYGPKSTVNINEGGKTKIDTIFYHLPAFQFYNQDGKTIGNYNFASKIWVAGFTSFQGKDAPSLAITMNRIEERTNLDTGLRMVTFTLDSESAKSMDDYAKMIHVAGKRRIFLSGNKEALNQLATNGFYKAVDSSTKNGFIHYFLIDKEGCIRGIYNGLHVKDVDYLIDDISVLEAAYYIEYEKKHKNEHDNDAI